MALSIVLLGNASLVILLLINSRSILALFLNYAGSFFVTEAPSLNSKKKIICFSLKIYFQVVKRLSFINN